MHSLWTIIVNWNGKDDTLECIASLQKVSIPKGLSMHILVVDNNSSDDSCAVILKKYPLVHVIQLPKNTGFTGGNNAGLSYALEKSASYIWLLNNDTYVDKNVVSALQSFEDPSVGLVGSKIFFAKGFEFHKERYKNSQKGHVFWYAGGNIDWQNMYATHRGVDEVDHGQYNDIIETAYITGCSMFMRADLVRKIGVFDTKYYLYFEDLDYSLRAKTAGYKLLYNPTSVVWHKNAGSVGGSGSDLQAYYMTRNRMVIGFRFAPLRTKVALLREAVGYMMYGNAMQRKAITDFFIQKFNKQYEE